MAATVCSASGLVVFFLLISTAFFVSAVVLDSLAEDYVRKLLEEFEKDSHASRYERVIEPPLCPRSSASHENRDFFMPRVFIWCPVTHFGTILRCPEHGSIVEVGEWTNVLAKKSCYRNPRLIYAIGGNVLLIQRVYLCRNGGLHHSYLSASRALLASAPKVALASFPFKVYHRAGCSKQLLNFVETPVLEGLNFFKIAETIASLNYKAYSDRGSIYLSTLTPQGTPGTSRDVGYSLDQFYNNILYSFPSTNLLIYVFLENLQDMKAFYEHELLTAEIISCDHTFKVSKNIVACRGSDQRFVKQFENLFIVLNEKKEVIEWRFTSSCAFEHIKDLLETLNCRPGVQLECIYVDDCCKMRQLYQQIFVDVPIKLDVFHAVQRVTSSIPKGTELARQISKEFGLVFRKAGDLGDTRSLPTPESAVIRQNMEMFCERWRNVLDQPELERTRHEMNKLLLHVNQGCLSDIRRGEGTEGNEALHRLLSRSLLCGAFNLGPELAIAILTVLFHAYNCRRKGERHTCNVKVTPVLPIGGQASVHQYHDVKVSSLLAPHFKAQDEPVPLASMWRADVDGASRSSVGDDSATPSMEESLLIADDLRHLCVESIGKKSLMMPESCRKLSTI